MPKTIVKIGPMDDGRQMSLDDFDEAEVQPGFHYELSRGIITVSDVPDLKHFAMVNEVRRQLGRYDLEHPVKIFGIAGSGECKIPLREYQSERHPDLAVYMTPPPGEGSIWGMWIPEIVVEIISARSRHRDYEEKPDEYFFLEIFGSAVVEHLVAGMGARLCGWAEARALAAAAGPAG